jgi:hypothetical protein
LAGSEADVPIRRALIEAANAVKGVLHKWLIAYDVEFREEPSGAPLTPRGP